MNARFNFSQKGQILVMFAIGLIGLLALGALVIDGGQTFVHRRQAQAAADAGAMAGAYQLCSGKSDDVSRTTAVSYATAENDATSATATIETTTINGKAHKQVRVDAVIQQTTFLAYLLGRPTMDIPATAAAGCFVPSSGSGVLPVAWSCREPIGASSSPDCAIQQIEWATLKAAADTCKAAGNNTNEKMAQCLYPLFPGKTYIVMDDLKSPLDHCISSGGTLNCDTNGDGLDDINYDGQRSWLNLNGGSPSAADLKNWIENGYPDPIYIHYWYPGKSGVSDTVFQTVDTYLVGKVALLPVINAVCPTDPLTTAGCLASAHTAPGGLPLEPGETDQAVYGGGPDFWGHVVGYATLYVSCSGKNSGCPGHDAAVAAGWFANNTKTIEGFFVRNYPIELTNPTSGGVDLGLYFASLTQ